MSTVKYLLAILLGIAVAACGGGGGGASSSTPAAPVTPPATYTISGMVTGTHPSGVTITLATAGGATTSTTTAANGTYSFAGVANGSYTVTPTLAGGYAFTPASKVVTVSGTNMTQDFTEATGATTGQITGTVIGVPTGGVTISFGSAGSTLTNSLGNYTMPGLVAGTYPATPSLSGYSFTPTSAFVTIASGGAAQANFTASALGVAYSISGTVTGVSAGGVTITVTGAATATATTIAGGTYTVPGLYNGSYTVAPSLTGYTFNPNSTPVTINGANVANTNFAGTANTAVKATVNGSVSGAWLQGVTITMSGGGTGSTTTDSSGNFSFANLASGASYTFTPSLNGYTYTASQTAVIPGGSSTAVTLSPMAASSTIPSFSISGTVSYGGTKTGPVYLWVYNTSCTGCASVAGTQIPLAGSSGSYSGSYTIRGLQNGSYTVVASLDALGKGQPNATDPAGSTAVTIGGANVPNKIITLADPSVALPAAPSLQSVSPGNGSALVLYNPSVDVNGTETATTYTLFWGTDTAASTGGGSINFNANGTNNVSYLLQQGMNIGTAYYFKLTASNSAGTTAASPVLGPYTIGASTGSYTVSGTVGFSGTATGPLLVEVHDNLGHVYYSVVGSSASPPGSGASYSIAGIPAGTYQISAVVDNNNDGLFDVGDFSYGMGGNTSLFSVSANTVQNITLPTAHAIAIVQTECFSTDGTSCTYSLNLGMDDGINHVVNVILISGPKVAVPFDIGVNSNSITTGTPQYTGTPSTLDSYGFLVTFSDGTTQIITGNVSGYLLPANLAQTLTVTPSPTRNQPTFNWAAPATLPTATPFFYTVQNLSGNNNISVPSSQFSVNSSLYGINLLTGTAYSWQVAVQDFNGNSAAIQAAPYTP